MGEEGDYLIRTCGDEDFAKRVQTESEQGPSRAAVCFDGNGMQARPGDAGFHRQRHSECQEREQRAQFVRVGQVRGLRLMRTVSFGVQYFPWNRLRFDLEFSFLALALF